MNLENYLWLVEIFLGLIAIFASNWALRKIIHRYSEKAAHVRGWQVKLDQIVFAPMRFILWAIGIAYVFSVLSYHFSAVESGEFFNYGRNACIVFALAWMALRWKKVMQDHLLALCSSSGRRDARHDPGTLRLVFKLFTAVIVILATLVMLQIFGVNIMPLLAFGGIGAAAVGFAAKDVIANFFEGFMLFVNRPFVEGDDIFICKEEIEGQIEKIGWYTTIVRDKRKCPVYLPNSLFSTAFVVNRSRMSHRLIEETLDIRYEDAGRIPELTELLRRFLAGHPQIDDAQPILIGVDGFGDYALNVKMEMYTSAVNESDYMQVRQEILLKINGILEQSGIEMPLPTQAVALIPAALERQNAALTLG